jgi:hypothetical protein
VVIALFPQLLALSLALIVLITLGLLVFKVFVTQF